MRGRFSREQQAAGDESPQPLGQLAGARPLAGRERAGNRLIDAADDRRASNIGIDLLRDIALLLAVGGCARPAAIWLAIA